MYRDGGERQSVEIGFKLHSLEFTLRLLLPNTNPAISWTIRYTAVKPPKADTREQKAEYVDFNYIPRAIAYKVDT